jgi:hypothetical protein
MDLKELGVFVEENRAKIKRFQDDNSEENLYTVLLEATDTNLRIISKYKSECEQASGEERVALEEMIEALRKCVVDSLSIVPF